MTGDLPVPLDGSGALRRVADDSMDRFADRTADLLDEEPVDVVWERPTDEQTRVWVRSDDVVVIGDELVSLTDGAAPVGAPHRLDRVGSWSRIRERPAGRRRWPRLGTPTGGSVTFRSRTEGGLWVVLADLGDGPVVDATDRRTGEVAWRHRIGSDDDLTAWNDWLATTPVALLDLDRRSRSTAPFRRIEPVSGLVVWTLPARLSDWSLAPDDVARGGAAPLVARQGDTMAGVDPLTGAVLWRTSLDRYAGLIDVQSGDDGVVAVSLGTEGAQRGWLNLCVRGRADGTHRWNQWWAGTRAARAAMVLCRGGVVSVEGSFLRSRTSRDGAARWSLPVEAIAGMTSDRHPDPRGMATLNVVEGGPRQPWAWLQRRGVGSAFVDAGSGRVVPLEGAIHLSTDGLVVTRTDRVVRCVALPSDLDD